MSLTLPLWGGVSKQQKVLQSQEQCLRSIIDQGIFQIINAEGRYAAEGIVSIKHVQMSKLSRDNVECSNPSIQSAKATGKRAGRHTETSYLLHVLI